MEPLDFGFSLFAALFLLFFSTGSISLFCAARWRVKKGGNALEFGDKERARPIHGAVAFFSLLHSLAVAAAWLIPGLREYSPPVFFGGASLFMFVYAFHLGVLVPLRCTRHVPASYLIWHPIYRSYYGFPTFLYQWDGKTYVSTAWLNLRHHEVFLQQYCTPCQYSIFINPRDPYEICTSRSGAAPVLSALLGLILLGFGLLVFWL